MTLMSWNCRGLRNTQTVRELKRLVKTQNPKVIFLCETKCSSKVMEKIMRSMNFFGLIVPSQGKSGGLALFWDKDWDVQIRRFSHNFIDAMVYDNVNSTWRVTGVYGFPEVSKRSETWRILKLLKNDSNLPWCVLGDFNEILVQEECKGGRVRPQSQMEAFRDFVVSAGLIDLLPEGYPFTWAKNWKYPNSYRARLDRALIDDKIMECWPKTKLLHIDANCSDHLPILLCLSKKEHFPRGRKKQDKKFRFEAMWVSHPDVEEIVNRNWSQNAFSLEERLQKCKIELIHWSKKSFGNIYKEADILRLKVANLKYSDDGNHSASDIEKLQKELEERLNQQELLWKQRSKELWLKWGDRNTTYFHKKASRRAKYNKIDGLYGEDGRWFEDTEDIQNLVVQHFQKIFSSDSPNIDEVRCVISRIRPMVSEEMKMMLSREYTVSDVYNALFSMNPLKALGPDGYTPQFYQKIWSILGKDLSSYVIRMLKMGSIHEKINQTTVVLIPKCANPKEISQLRPISLCEVIYRVASKMLANRLKALIPALVSPFQSAFINKRQITDNVLISHEIHNLLKRRRNGTKGFMSIKLDMSKAFDRVEWPFLLMLLEQLGFPEGVVDFIKSCISTAKFTFSLNGSSFGQVTPTRGLRQGDPISPYLFILCTDVLSRLLQDAMICKKIAGVKVGRNDLRICHLMFADDTVLFGEATLEEARAFAEVLSLYCLVSGQKVNQAKSGIMFSPNVPLHLRLEICNILGFIEVDKHEKYLGLPAITGRSKQQIFSSIKERILSRICGWDEKFLSRAGKETLIKSVVQAIPAYAMSVFKIPDKILDDIQSAISNFWWGKKGKTKGIHWLSWKKLCESKDLGGLGLRDMKAFKLALLTKQAWKILTEPESLLHKVYKSLYFSDGDFLRAVASSRASYSWRGILEAKEILLDGLKWQIGNGNTVSIFKDKWLPGDSPRKLHAYTDMQNSIVEEHVDFLIDSGNQTWDIEKVCSIFDTTDAQEILKVPIGSVYADDIPVWPFTKNGYLTVRSAYHFILQRRKSGMPSCSNQMNSDAKKWWKKIWSLNMASKVKIFIWRLCQNALPTYENLEKKGLYADNICFLCKMEDGSLTHLLTKCPVAVQVWALSGLWSIIRPDKVNDVIDWIFQVLKSENEEVIEKFAVILSKLWSSRNESIFEGIYTDPMRLLKSAMFFWEEYKDANKREVEDIERTQNRDERRWEAPSQGVLKINVDATRKRNGECAIGIIVRDCNGSFVAAIAQRVLYWDDIEVLEAFAIKEACCWCIQNNHSSVVLESDAQAIVKMLELKEVNRSRAGVFIEEAKRMIKDRDIRLQWIPRGSNKVAHVLANFAIQCNERNVWTEYPPECLIDSLLEDQLHM